MVLMTKVKTKGNELLWYPLLKKSPTLHTITEHASQWAMTILKNNVKKFGHVNNSAMTLTEHFLQGNIPSRHMVCKYKTFIYVF